MPSCMTNASGSSTEPSGRRLNKKQAGKWVRANRGGGGVNLGWRPDIGPCFGYTRKFTSQQEAFLVFVIPVSSLKKWENFEVL